VTASLVLKEEQGYFPKVIPAAICRSVPAEKWNMDGDKLVELRRYSRGSIICQIEA
jgi:hypothetical protein